MSGAGWALIAALQVTSRAAGAPPTVATPETAVKADSEVPAKALPEAPAVRLWWSFPGDDDTAIEIDDPDLSVSRWADDRPRFIADMQKCDLKRSKQLAEHRDPAVPLREIRIERRDDKGELHTTRCVMTLRQWRTRLGRPLVLRVDDELDAHASFLLPRRGPGMPPKSLDGEGGAPARRPEFPARHGDTTTPEPPPPAKEAP